jgi:phosphopantothenoylcysteine synthetase/decarboxylase
VSTPPWIIVTAGGTREPIDAVRYIGNVSTGRTGCAVAGEGLRRGFGVVLVHAVDAVRPEPAAGLELVPFLTGADLTGALDDLARRCPGPRAIVHAAAVGDYAPRPARGKIPSGRRELVLKLEPTPKIVAGLRRLFPESLIVQFKLEVGLGAEALCAKARASARTYGADLVVANDLRDVSPTRHRAFVLDMAGGVIEVTDHTELAEVLLDRIEGGG